MTWLLLTILFCAAISAAIAGFSAAPWLPTKPSQRRRLLETINFSQAKTVIDLGCGDGSILFALAKKYPNLIAKGCDINILPFLIGILRKIVWFKKYRHVKLAFANLYTYQINDADFVFIFLLPNSYPKLLKKLSTELKADAIVVVEAWPLPNVKPLQIITEHRLLPIYLYRGQDLEQHVQKASA